MTDNPQKQFIEPLPSPQKWERMPKDDMPLDSLYDINEAVRDAEADRQEQRSYANVGYAALKRRR